MPIWILFDCERTCRGDGQGSGGQTDLEGKGDGHCSLKSHQNGNETAWWGFSEPMKGWLSGYHMQFSGIRTLRKSKHSSTMEHYLLFVRTCAKQSEGDRRGKNVQTLPSRSLRFVTKSCKVVEKCLVLNSTPKLFPPLISTLVNGASIPQVAQGPV